MISVPNHRPLLNGNKFPVLLFLFLLLVSSSCSIFKPAPPEDPDYGQNNRPNNNNGNSNDPDPVDNNDPEKPEGPVDTVTWVVEDPLTPPPSLLEEDPLTGVITVNKEKMTKSSYNVVVMLPFFTNYFVGGFSDIPDEAYLALEFYEGLKLAFKQLEGEGLNLNVSVMDTQADTLVVASLLERQSVLDADLIIGPVTRDNNRIVANFARAYKKNVISPLNPRTDIIEQNPFYIQVNPSTKTHFNEMMRHVHSNYRGHRISIIAPEGRSGKARVDYIQEANKIYHANPSAPDIPVTYFKLEEGASIDVKEVLDLADTTVVIIPSRDPGFVGFLLRELNIVRVRQPVVVFGMPRWKDFEQIDYNYYENLNVHITNSGFVSNNQDGVLHVKQNYYADYGNVPNMNVYKGYDIALYFGNMLKDYGVYFQGFFEEANGVGLHTTFKFRPVYDNPGIPTEDVLIVRQYENSYINILRFDEFRFKRISY